MPGFPDQAAAIKHLPDKLGDYKGTLFFFQKNKELMVNRV